MRLLLDNSPADRHGPKDQMRTWTRHRATRGYRHFGRTWTTSAFCGDPSRIL